MDECEITMKYAMASTCEDENMESGSSLGNRMSLRERVRKSMGNGVQVSWSSLPEVKSSGLLDTLSEKQLALEELKFCLITCEVAFSTELVELISLAKKSINWADSLPSFNRRTIAMTVERVKRCSDSFLTSMEKHWNTKPIVNMATVYKVLTDLTSQYQIYVTYCTHQEDLRSVLRTAMVSKTEVKAAAYSNRMNVERAMLPLQHLKFFRSLLQDIRSFLIENTNRLENFHCRRILIEITKILEECYRMLAMLHGTRYVEKLDKLLDESVHGTELETKWSNDTGELIYEDKIPTNERLSSIDSIDTDSKKENFYKRISDGNKIQVMDKNRPQTVKERCKYFSLQDVEINNNSRQLINYKDRQKCDSNKIAIVRRQKPVQVGKKKVGVAVKHRSNPIITERRALFELSEPNNKLYKGQKLPAKSKYTLFDFPYIIGNATVKDRLKCISMSNAVNGSFESEIGNTRISWLKDKLKLPNYEHMNIPVPRNNTDVSDTSDSFKSTKNEFPHAKESAVSQKSAENDSKVVRIVQGCSLPPTYVEDTKNVCSVQNDVMPCSCSRKLSTCTATCVIDNLLNTELILCVGEQDTTTSKFLQLKIMCGNGEVHSVDTNSQGKESGTHNEPGVDSEIEVTSPSVEKTSFDQGELIYNYNTDVTDYEDVELAKEPSVIMQNSKSEKPSNAKDDDPSSSSDEQQIKQNTFLSSYDLGYPTVTYRSHFPLWKENVETGEIYSAYLPMNESFKKSQKCILSTPAKSVHCKINCESETRALKTKCESEHESDTNTISASSATSDYCDHVYEECIPLFSPNKNVNPDKLEMNADVARSNIFTVYEDVPLYQVYNFKSATHSCSSVEEEEDIYVDGEEHVYEEVCFCPKIEVQNTEEIKPRNKKNEPRNKKNEPRTKEKRKSQKKKINEQTNNYEDISSPTLEISRPSGSNHRVHWTDISQVRESGLLDKLDTNEIALQEAKYEFITSEASYYKSLIILDVMFMTNSDLIIETNLSKEDQSLLFSAVEKVKQCSEKFLTILVDGWEQDLMLGYLCRAVLNFVESGAFLCYILFCGSQVQMDKTLQYLKLTNQAFAQKLSELEGDPICQTFSLQSFLTLPMQRITRLPLLVQAILRRLPENHAEYNIWKAALIELQEIVYQCNEAAGIAQELVARKEDQVIELNNKTLTVNANQSSDSKKKQTTFWDLLKIRKQRVS